MKSRRIFLRKNSLQNVNCESEYRYEIQFIDYALAKVQY